MASYFVARSSAIGGLPAVHDRSRCPPGSFPPAGAEYLGDFLDAGQALAVARLRYVNATRCSCCAVQRVPPLPVMRLLPALRS